MNQTLIVAIGNTVMSDDAIAYHILQSLKKRRIKADLIDLGTDVSRLRLHIKPYYKKIIIIDALVMNEKPGTILFVDYPQFEEILEGNVRNAHFLGMVEILKIFKLVDENFKNIDFLFCGIVVQTIEKGFQLSKKVEQAIPESVEKIIRLL